MSCAFAAATTCCSAVRGGRGRSGLKPKSARTGFCAPNQAASRRSPSARSRSGSTSPRGVVTYHFAGKEEIVAAVLESAVAEIDQATRSEVEASLSVAERVRAVLRTKVHGFLGHPEAAESLLAFWAGLAREGPVRRLTARLFDDYRAQCARLVRAARKANPRCEAEPEAMATLLVGTVIGIVIQTRFAPQAIPVEAAIEEAVRAFASRLGAR